jgi:glucosamine-6-phosphate isomerase
MEIKLFDDYDALSQQAAEDVLNLVKQKPEAVICLASGSTPLRTCQCIVKKAGNGNMDLSKCNFIGLDEWVGITKDNPGSCYYFFYNHLFKPLGISATQTFLFDAMAADLNEQCKRMDKVVNEKGGIDLMIVGIGMNGHIGFNEPGVSFDLFSHVIDLHETTKSIGQKYFSESTSLTRGITLGLGHLMNAKKVILMANGKNKSAVIKQAVNGPVTESMPASILQRHKNSSIYADKEAASML